MTTDYLGMVLSDFSSNDNKELEKEKQKNVLDFIYQLLRRHCEPGKYIEFLRDGVVIEELMMRACPTPLGKKIKNKLPKNPTPQDRAEKIINDMFEYGLPLEHLFEPDDLLQAKNIPKVTEALLQISKMVYTGQGRSRLKSVADNARAPFKCSVCTEKFARSDQLKDHMCKKHPDRIGPNLKRILQQYS